MEAPATPESSTATAVLYSRPNEPFLYTEPAVRMRIETSAGRALEIAGEARITAKRVVFLPAVSADFELFEFPLRVIRDELISRTAIHFRINMKVENRARPGWSSTSREAKVSLLFSVSLVNSGFLRIFLTSLEAARAASLSRSNSASGEKHIKLECNFCKGGHVSCKVAFVDPANPMNIFLPQHDVCLACGSVVTSAPSPSVNMRRRGSSCQTTSATDTCMAVSAVSVS
mmetsp:Transcript_26701/g.46015  ORF Transcript_26701/g.46015 Transcript_26701/m.46015 type:complete len:230 (-) Transcript_26701:1170-1859(-)